MKAGFSDTDITPAMGSQRPGNYRKIFLTGVRDNLRARAAVFSDDRNTVAIIGLDTLVVRARTVKLIRAEIEKKSGGKIKSENVMIAASHTHSGGPCFGFHPDELKEAPALIKKLALECSINMEPEYERLVVERASDAVFLAFNKMDAVKFSAGSGPEGAAVFNRRIRMKGGRTFTHPGKGNPDIVEPAGPIDPEVGVIGGWRENGALAGCVVNYACHGTAWSQDIVSADWISAMEKTIRAVYGREVVVVFLNGACGDITQVDNIGLRKNHSPEEWLNIIGTRVGAEAVKILVSSEKGDLAPVKSVSQKIKINRRILSPEKLKKSLETVRSMAGNESNSRKDEFAWAKEKVLLDYLLQQGKAKEIEIQAIQLGPAIFLSNPAEYFCSLGLAIKKIVRERFPFVYVVELANGSIGYVPDEEAFKSTGGGYETKLTSYSNLEPAAGRIIADACMALAGRLCPGEVPRGPQIEKPATSWSYGNESPEIE
ncbi:MAG: hypothetical protein PHW60_01685 [Kiritimatiellae bacterium]|nr:hypothetical protein [Kiritimatiellia bacterium]